MRDSILDSLRSLTAAILDPRREQLTLRPEIVELAALLSGLGTMPSDSRADIATGERQTAGGVAISPRMAALCAEDFLRTVVFMRGLHEAIRDVAGSTGARPVRVLYAGCGPLAILALPLMTVFPSREVRFTLLDIHPASTASVEAMLASLELSDHVAELQTTDALAYRVPGDAPPDIILLESMRAVLEVEPQVALTRHLLEQAPEATLIPAQIDIDLELVNPEREFSFEQPGREAGRPARERVPLGTVFSVNRETVKAWSDLRMDDLPGESLTIPDHVPHVSQPMLFTRIRVYGDHTLGDYDSGLTCPRILPVGRNIRSGDRLEFRYRPGRAPRLHCRLIVDRSRLNLAFDPERLQADLRGISSSDWIQHFVHQNYEGDWSVIALRGPSNARHPVMAIYSDPACDEFSDTPVLDSCPYFREVLETFQCRLLAVRLMKLAPGSRILEHSDHDLDLESGVIRLHVPVVTNDDVDFRLNGSRVVLEEGECWYLRLSDPHAVENNGASDRIHLVIDAEVNPWLLNQIENPSAC